MAVFRFSILKVALFASAAVLSISWRDLSVFAEQRELPQPRAAVDAVLLIDASGSMLKTDAQNLRYEGAKLFLKFLGENDRLAIVSFSNKAHVISDLRDFKKDSVNSTVHEIEAIKTEGQFSDIYEGIKKSEQILNASPRNDADRVIVLLSDGKMEPDPTVSMPATRTVALVNELLPELKAREIKIHSLAFSDQADKVLLGEISAATDGLNWYTATPDDVHKSFANLFLAVKRPQVVPLTSRGFSLDDDVDEATFYITRDEGSRLTLISPKNEEMTVEKIPEWVTWFAGKNFDVITMREPDPGEWQVMGGASAEGFATVLTHLRLVTDWPVIVRSEDKNIVQARLYDGEKPVSLPEMSGVVRYAFQISPTDKVAEPVVRDLLNDEGQDGDKIAKDGIFSKAVTLNEPGEYKLSIVARGPTFERTQQVPFRVRPRLLTLSVVSPEEAEHGGASHAADAHDEHASHADGEHGDNAESSKEPLVKGDQHFVLKAELSKEALSFKSFEIRVEALSHERKKSFVTLKRSHHDPLVYEGSSGALPKDGRYTLRAFLKGETKKLQEVEAESKPVRFERTSVKDNQPTPTPEPIKEPVPEQKPSQIPLLQVALITLANLLAVGVGFALTKRSRSSAPTAASKYIPPKQVLEAIADLEERVITTPEMGTDPVVDGMQEAKVSSDESSAPSEGSTTNPPESSPESVTENTSSEGAAAEAADLAEAVDALSDEVGGAAETSGDGDQAANSSEQEDGPKEG
jgi:uncharacterized protein (TIGR03503 family)